MSSQGRLVPNLSERDQSLYGPRSLKPVGSAEWCWQTIELLKNRYRDVDERWHDVEDALSELEQVRAWDVVPPHSPYGSLDQMLRAELGIGADQVRSRVVDAKTAAERAKPLADHGELGRGRTRDSGRNSIKGGENADYLTARIARDHKPILEGMKRGEYTSVRQAAKAAGILKDRVKVTPTVDGFLKAIRTHLDEKQVRQLVDELCGVPA